MQCGSEDQCLQPLHNSKISALQNDNTKKKVHELRDKTSHSMLSFKRNNIIRRFDIKSISLSFLRFLIVLCKSFSFRFMFTGFNKKYLQHTVQRLYFDAFECGFHSIINCKPIRVFTIRLKFDESRPWIFLPYFIFNMTNL